METPLKKQMMKSLLFSILLIFSAVAVTIVADRAKPAAEAAVPERWNANGGRIGSKA